MGGPRSEVADRLKETEVAAAVIAWLEDRGWDVYQEVKVRDHGRVADIVAVQERRVWVVECKTSLSLTVIGQAYDWQESVHWVSVAVPVLAKRKGGYPIRGQRPRFVDSVLRDYGIGLFQVERRKSFGQVPTELVCHERFHPALRRTPGKNNLRFMAREIRHVLEGLCEEQKTFAEAGNADGKYWTPWRRTCSLVRKAVERQPGICVAELIREEGYFHYASSSSARSSLSHWLREGKVPGVKVVREGRKLACYPEKFILGVDLRGDRKGM
jgi:hypothetical protein